MSLFRNFAAAFTFATLAACAQTTPPPPASAQQDVRAPVTILVSIDGFRPDYLDRGVTPVLSRLAAEGARGAMRPSFPSKTFPNHYALVTGMRPDRSGIVANKMEDPRRPGELFTMASDDPFWWNEAEPIWVTAEKAGGRTATMFWPGSNVAIGGVRAQSWPHAITGGTRPQDWQQFNQEISGTQRVNAVLDWLRRPAAIRPALLTLYFDTVDTAGHTYGPDDPRTNAAVAEVDGMIGMLVEGLARLGQPANLVIVADHGMAATSSTRTIALDGLLATGDYRVIEAGPYAALVATPGREAALEAKLLQPHAHMQCWRKAEMPARFHYGLNPRVPPYLCLAEMGWLIAQTAPKSEKSGGDHGFDPEAAEMRALFIAHGPNVRGNGQTLPVFDNVDVYPFLAALAGVHALATDGHAETLKPLLDRPDNRSGN